MKPVAIYRVVIPRRASVPRTWRSCPRAAARCAPCVPDIPCGD